MTDLADIIAEQEAESRGRIHLALVNGQKMFVVFPPCQCPDCLADYRELHDLRAGRVLLD